MLKFVWDDCGERQNLSLTQHEFLGQMFLGTVYTQNGQWFWQAVPLEQPVLLSAKIIREAQAEVEKQIKSDFAKL